MGIRLENISLDIKGKRILDDVNLEVKDREFVSLLGGSGAGKTTTIKIISGILGQTEGHVYIDDVVADKLPTHKRKTSIVFQDIRLFPHMSVGENVAYSMRVQGVKKAERIKRADYYLELVRLGGFGARRVDELSGGQQQRVALARSVAGSPKVLLLDEPFSGLDEELRDDMRTTVRHIHDTLNLTTLMITHDADEALMMSDRIAYLTRGHVVQYCEPAELYSHPATIEAAACFGDCLSLPGLVGGGIFASPGFSCPTECADGPATAILRRHGLSLAEDPAGVPVVESSFRGEQYYTTVKIGGKEYSLYSHESFDAGELVRLECKANAAFVFSAPAAGAAAGEAAGEAATR